MNEVSDQQAAKPQKHSSSQSWFGFGLILILSGCNASSVILDSARHTQGIKHDQHLLSVSKLESPFTVEQVLEIMGGSTQISAKSFPKEERASNQQDRIAVFPGVSHRTLYIASDPVTKIVKRWVIVDWSGSSVEIESIVRRDQSRNETPRYVAIFAFMLIPALIWYLRGRLDRPRPRFAAGAFAVVLLVIGYAIALPMMAPGP